MNMEAMTDRAVETATDAAAEAYSVPDAQFVYTKESWADCAADLILGDDESCEELRKVVQRVLFWTNAVHGPTVDAGHAVIVGSALASSIQALGYLIATTAMKNGVTLENIGQVER